MPVVSIFFSTGPGCIRRGSLRGRHPCMPFLCSVRQIVSRETVAPARLSTSSADCRRLARFSSTHLIRILSCWGVDFRGGPGRLCEMVAVPSLVNVVSLLPQKINQVVLSLCKEMIFFFLRSYDISVACGATAESAEWEGVFFVKWCPFIVNRLLDTCLMNN